MCVEPLRPRKEHISTPTGHRPPDFRELNWPIKLRVKFPHILLMLRCTFVSVLTLVKWSVSQMGSISDEVKCRVP